VIIGGWWNGQSVIRLNRNKELVENATDSFLSKDEYRGFWISWSKEKLTVGKEDEVSPFLTYTAPNHFEFGFYSLWTGFGSSGLWIVEGRI